jgi:acetyltransferase-like isoleucine patch superfamily enzyme
MTDPRIEELRELGACIADDVYFGPEVYIEKDFAPLLSIERGAVLSQGVTILLHDSSLNNVVGAPLELAPVALRENCYLGANVTVMCGVEVGAGALIGACSLVDSDIPAGLVAYGIPARPRGSTLEAAERHRRRIAERPMWRSLESAPWRDRSTEDNAALERRIRHLMDEMAGPGS